LKRHVAEFLRFLNETGKLAFDMPASMLGHAYLLYREIRRNIVADGVLLIGDSAGLAYSMSGEGIRPAIESGLLAAKTVVEANGRYSGEELEKYRASLISRFGNPEKHWSASVRKYVPTEWIAGVARILLASSWFSRHVILDRWFLHFKEPALNFEMPRAMISAVERSVGVGAGL
ncbi:MAG: NAD(P)/FAD-dependent oxidoreductase, partial [Candidatus Acidiferrales bacterium]